MRNKTIISFLSCFLGLSGLFQLNAQNNSAPTSPAKHHLPASDRQYRTTTSYVEEIPVKEYKWASDNAYKDFQDLK